MSNHTYRKGYNIDPFAEWVRRELPGAREGIVRIDLDTAFRRYGHNYGLDSDGDLMLLEQKSGNEELTGGEYRIYDSIAAMAERDEMAEKMRSRFRGWYELRIRYKSYPKPCDKCGQPIETADEAYARFLAANLELGKKPMLHAELRAFLLGVA